MSRSRIRPPCNLPSSSFSCRPAGFFLFLSPAGWAARKRPQARCNGLRFFPCCITAKGVPFVTTKQAKQKRQNRLGTVLAILIFLLGLGILFYPVASDLWNQHRQNQLISHYTQSTTTLAPEDHSALWEAAQEYNKNLSPTFRDAFTGRQLPAGAPTGACWIPMATALWATSRSRASACGCPSTTAPRRRVTPAWHRASRRYLPAGGRRGHPRGVFRPPGAALGAAFLRSGPNAAGRPFFPAHFGGAAPL